MKKCIMLFALLASFVINCTMALAGPMTFDLDTMLPSELDALIDMVEDEKREATDFPYETSSMLSDNFEQLFEGTLPSDADVSYPFFGFDKTRSRDMYMLSGDMSVKYADKSKQRFENVTVIYWKDEGGTFNLAAFFSDDQVYRLDKTYYVKASPHLSKEINDRLSSSYAEGVNEDSSSLAALAPAPTPTIEPTPEPTKEPENTITYAIANKGVNIRKEANSDSKRMGFANQGDKLIITQAFYTDKWHQIDYNGQTCYVSANFCDIADASDYDSVLSLESAATPTQKPTEEPEYTVTYIGNRSTKKFHEEYCSSVDKMKESNKVNFTTREAAVKKGYTPCQRCKP